MIYKKLYFIAFFVLLLSSINAQTYVKQPLSRQDSAQIIKYENNYQLYISKNDYRNASDFYNKTARIYWNHNHFQKAIDYYLVSLDLNNRLGNQNGIAGINSNLGLLYSDLGQFEKSVKYLEQSVAARRGEKDSKNGRESLFNSLLNLSTSLSQLGKYDEAIKYLKEALSFAQEINNLEKISIFYLQLADVYEKSGDEETSKDYLNKYLMFYKQMQDEVVEKTTVQMENQRLRAEKIELDKKLKELELQEKKEEIKEKEQEIEDYSTKTDSLTTSLNKEQLAKKLLQEQADREAEKAERERVTRQRNQIIFAGILLIVLSVALFMYYLFKQKKKANIELENKNTRILKQQNELNLKNQTLEKQKAEILKQKDLIVEQQEELIRKEKLASIGNLTKGIVDRLINPLNYINNFSGISYELGEEIDEIVEEDKGIHEETKEELEDVLSMLQSNMKKIVEHGTSATLIVKGMEKLLKEKSTKFYSTDINTLIEQASYVTITEYKSKNEIKEGHIEINFELNKNLEEISILPNEFEDAIKNIINNTCYSLFLKLEKNKQDYVPKITISTSKANENCIIKIKDNGNGMPESELIHVFEPFYTTKPTSKGIGLGLYIVEDIIKIHKGKIMLNSKENEYTEVIIELPYNKDLQNSSNS